MAELERVAGRFWMQPADWPDCDEDPALHHWLQFDILHADRRFAHTQLVAEYAFSTSRDHAKLWILEHQAGRRNLTDDQRAVVRNKLREQRSRIVQAEKLRKARDVKAGISISVDLPEIEQPKRDTRAEVAQEAHLSESKLRRAQKLKKYQPQLYEKVLRGELTLRDVVKEFPSWRERPEEPRNHDHFRHLGNLLDRAFKGTLKARLDYLLRLKAKDMTPTIERNVREVISILADVSRQADSYASRLEKMLLSCSSKKRKAA